MEDHAVTVGGYQPGLIRSKAEARSLSIALLVLAVDRSASFLPMLGVPESMAANPRRLRDLARRTIHDLQRQDESPAHSDAAGLTPAIHAVAVAFTAGIVDAYGEVDTRRLVEWLRRYRIDREEALRWEAWSLLFQRVAYAAPERLPALDNAIWKRLRDEATSSFGPLAWSEVAARLSDAREARADATERDLLEMEVSQPGDERNWDVVQDIELLISSTRAHAAFHSLKSRMSAADWDEVVQWARIVLKRWNDEFHAEIIARDASL